MSFMMKRSSKMGDVLVSVLGDAFATDRHLFQLVPLNGSSDLSPLPEQSLEVTFVAADACCWFACQHHHHHHHHHHQRHHHHNATLTGVLRKAPPALLGQRLQLQDLHGRADAGDV